MVVVLNDSLISLRTSIDDKMADCLLDSGASHNFLASNWCKERGIEIEDSHQFGIRLADGQEVPVISKVCCIVDLGPMKTALTLYVLDCNVPCMLGLPFLQTVNPKIDWVFRSVQVHVIVDLSLLEVVKREIKP